MQRIFERFGTTRERQGELILLSGVLLFAAFPVLINYTTKLMPPILYAASSMLIAGLILLPFVLSSKEARNISGEAIKQILRLTFFILILGMPLVFVGASKTSAINTAVLLQAEVLTTFLVLGLLHIEPITKEKIFGAIFVLFGATLVLWHGSFPINQGDLLIVAGTFFFPIGNIFAKRAVKLTSPIVIICIRSIVGGAVLLLFSLFFEHHAVPAFTIMTKHAALIAMNGIGIYAISKLFWYEGLKRLELTKAVPFIFTTPAVSLLYAYLLLHEIPTVLQIVGVVIVIGGVFTLMRTQHRISNVVVLE